MKKLVRSIFISLEALALIVCTACGAPQTPSVPTTVPTNTQPFPTATMAPSAAPVVSPTSAAPTLAATPSATPVPTVPAAPTLTPPPVSGASHDTSRLIFPTDNGVMSVSADGAGKQLFSQVRPEFARNLRDALSPIGDWIAFISGDDPSIPDQQGNGPLMLNLLDVSTGQVKPITPLFSADMERAIRSATARGDRNDAIEAAIAIIDNSDTLKWSPDGRYVAFIAAIDGPSSDVYCYDLETGKINRLTDGPNQAARLFWSPDSQWIVHEEVESFGTGAGWNVIAVWAAAPDGNTTRKVYNAGGSGDEVFVDWVAPDTFLVYSWTAVGWRNVRLVNLATGEARVIGPDFPVQTLAYDPKTQTQLYFALDFTGQQQGLQDGLYLAVPDVSTQPRLVAAGDWYDTRWLPQVQLFCARGKEGVICVTLNGTVEKLDAEQDLPIESPAGTWLLAWGDGNYLGPTGLRLYTPDGTLRRTITDDSVGFASWSPDSTGVFYSSGGNLYYTAIPNGKPQMVDDQLSSAEPTSFVWLRRS